GVGVAKVHQQSIAQKLRGVSFVTLNDFSTSSLIGSDYAPIVFRVELAGELRRVHQIAEHHLELSTFSFGYTSCWYGDFLSRWSLFKTRLRLGPVVLAVLSLDVFGFTGPSESSLICLYRRFMDIQEFIFQIVKVVVIEVEASLESTIRHTSLAFQEGDDLFEN